MHNLDDQTRPAREMLRTLSLARVGVILFPRETRFLPRVVDGVDQVLAEGVVHFRRFELVRARLFCDILYASKKWMVSFV